MNHLTLNAVDKLSSLRSIALIGMTLLTTNVFYRLSAPLPERVRSLESCHCGKRPVSVSDVSLEPIDIEQPTDRVPVGAHLVSPRRFYIHHGIYLGGGAVAHYSGFSGSLRSGPIEVTDLEHFALGKPVWRIQEKCNYSSHEIVDRARSRLGENRYRVFSNNCEHFCSWCISGENYSAQVSAYLRRPRDVFALIYALKPHFIA
ncbi:lecithin retinol acyltransferase family protein [Pseudomonas sp. Q11]|uniref:lecithin retinol acyltransferase family protein n=1 Tax=Pseudomonas sp. Q11 TaxID=2968470 RepID=UPI00210A0915|nr:lecithin retinol acyltransferase family protein [Pseudomonas sp. Q11]MCQ6255684.1 lecithin retinol acyltransferase family protein [Pseudomonas sp. Q11]